MGAPLVGTHFVSFLILFIPSVFAAAIVCWVAGYRFVTGSEGFPGKWIFAWLGAWLEPVVVGQWFGPVKLWNSHIIPALMWAFVGAFGATACCTVAGRIQPQKAGLESIGVPKSL